MDPRAALARDNHRLAREREGQASQHRDIRDRIVRQLRAEDPEKWTYPALARAVQCSEQLIAYILKRKPRREPGSGQGSDPEGHGFLPAEDVRPVHH
jgi:hypothetical protein